MSHPDGERALTIYTLAAQEMGIEVRLLDQESKVLAEMIRGDRRRYILAGHVPLNDSLSARLADDKYYTAMLLEREGIRVPRGVRCLRPGHFKGHSYGLQEGPAPGLEFARQEGYPVVVKPNKMSGGQFVSVAEDAAQVRESLAEIWTQDPLALVQQRLPGVDIRLDFLAGEFLAGYTRSPLRLRGDGRSTIRQLAELQDRRYSGDMIWKQAADFPDWRRQVTSHGWTEQSVPPQGQELQLGGDILNLRRFALARPVDDPGPEWVDTGRRIADLFGLRHLGIDFRAPSLDASPRESAVVDVNPRPGLTQLFRMGHRRRVLDACIRVLDAVFADGTA